jgi:hypothetical protein
MVSIRNLRVFIEHRGLMRDEAMFPSPKDNRLIFVVAQRRQAHKDTQGIRFGGDYPEVRRFLAGPWRRNY